MLWQLGAAVCARADSHLRPVLVWQRVVLNFVLWLLRLLRLLRPVIAVVAFDRS